MVLFVVLPVFDPSSSFFVTGEKVDAVGFSLLFVFVLDVQNTMIQRQVKSIQRRKVCAATSCVTPKEDWR